MGQHRRAESPANHLELDADRPVAMLRDLNPLAVGDSHAGLSFDYPPGSHGQWVEEFGFVGPEDGPEAEAMADGRRQVAALDLRADRQNRRELA